MSYAKAVALSLAAAVAVAAVVDAAWAADGASCEDLFEPAPTGFEVVTARDDPALEPGSVEMAWTGPIDFPAAAHIAEAWSELSAGADLVILDLDSPGGELDEVEAVIAVLATIRESARLVTRVGQGRRCLSACALVFVQGEERLAGNASSWMFHGPCQRHTNVPEHEAVDRYVRIMSAAGVDAGFLDRLRASYLLQPGSYWLSGFELHRLHRANIITRLLEAWQPETPRQDLDPQIRPR